MEPMALGSPSGTSPSIFQSPSISSPMTSPHVVGPQHQQGGFLPNFLVGDHSQAKPSSLYASPVTSPPLNPSTLVSPSKWQSESVEKPNHPVSNTGPPVSGLLSSNSEVGIESNAMRTPGMATPTVMQPKSSTRLFSSSNRDGGVKSPFDIREEVLNQPQAYEENNTWVTVFGFPPSASSYILSKFSQYGNVITHRRPPQGNWMHIKYQTRLQAQKALSKSESLIGGTLMIGVTVYHPQKGEESLLEANNDTSIASTSSFALPDSTRNKGGLSQANNNTSVLNRSSMRPLAQVLKDDRDRGSPCLNSAGNGGGIVGKAMEYIFGWTKQGPIVGPVKSQP